MATAEGMWGLLTLYYICFLFSATVKLAEENKDFVIGFICQNSLSEDPQLLHLTPGL